MRIVVAPKDPDQAATYEIEVIDLFMRDAYRGYQFSLTEFVKAPRDTGFYFECTKAGRTADSYPVSWPRREGETIKDGSAEWTSVHPDNALVVTVSTVVWSIPTGLTLDSQSHSGHIVRGTFSGGSDGVDYDVTATITPSTGNPEDYTITIPVREQ